MNDFTTSKSDVFVVHLKIFNKGVSTLTHSRDISEMYYKLPFLQDDDKPGTGLRMI